MTTRNRIASTEQQLSYLFELQRWNLDNDDLREAIRFARKNRTLEETSREIERLKTLKERGLYTFFTAQAGDYWRDTPIFISNDLTTYVIKQVRDAKRALNDQEAERWNAYERGAAQMKALTNYRALILGDEVPSDNEEEEA